MRHQDFINVCGKMFVMQCLDYSTFRLLDMVIIPNNFMGWFRKIWRKRNIGVSLIMSCYKHGL